MPSQTSFSIFEHFFFLSIIPSSTELDPHLVFPRFPMQMSLTGLLSQAASSSEALEVETVDWLKDGETPTKNLG